MQAGRVSSSFVMAALVCGLGACVPTAKYVLGANPGVAKDAGRWTQGTSCRISLLGISFGAAAPDRAITDALSHANIRDKRMPGNQYDVLVDATLRDTQTMASYCFEASGYPARLTIEDGEGRAE